MECDVMTLPTSRAHHHFTENSQADAAVIMLLAMALVSPVCQCPLTRRSCSRPLSCSPTKECVLCFCVCTFPTSLMSDDLHVAQAAETWVSKILLPKISPFTIKSTSVSNSAAHTSCMLWACALLKPRAFSRSLHPSLELRTAPHCCNPAQAQ
jgi:hypothetical protein